VDVARNGGRVRLFRNVAAITMDLNDVESLVLRALGGADVITVDVSLYGSQVLVGGLVPRLSITGSEPANDRLQVNTLAGNDQVTVAPPT